MKIAVLILCLNMVSVASSSCTDSKDCYRCKKAEYACYACSPGEPGCAAMAEACKDCHAPPIPAEMYYCNREDPSKPLCKRCDGTEPAKSQCRPGAFVC